MIIAVLSGKGGTGKTFLSVNLALAGIKSTYLDCDVEAPNGNLFLKAKDVKIYNSEVVQPEFDSEKCTGCRKCVDFCKFNALAFIKTPKLFPDICHSCGGCEMACEFDAITEVPRKKGEVQVGYHNDVLVVSGYLNEGEASGVSVIEDTLEHMEGNLNIIDCPPGSACNTMAAIGPADYCLLVAEPTAFGLHNFRMVVELAEIFDKKVGVVINKCDLDKIDNNMIKTYCDEKGLKILDTIAYDDELAKTNAHGIAALEAPEKSTKRCRTILDKSNSHGIESVAPSNDLTKRFSDMIKNIEVEVAK
ncbi:MAG: ATP-binding protein [Peptostreptococcaceae bacterium]|nr:ATP-binding protein [Peptostreptococcaceae bacterium]